MLLVPKGQTVGLTKLVIDHDFYFNIRRKLFAIQDFSVSLVAGFNPVDINLFRSHTRKIFEFLFKTDLFNYGHKISF